MSRYKATASSALSNYIGKLTGDGEELVNLLLTIARGSAPDRIRLEALDMLMDRFAGKAPLVVEATLSPGPTHQMTARMIEMSESQLEALALLGTGTKS